MKNIKIIKIIILICLISSISMGCTSITQDVNSEVSNTILTGCNLDDLGWSIEYEYLKEFEDPNKDNYQPIYTTLHTNGDDQITTIDGDLDSYGNITVLGMNFTDNRADVNFMPMIYIQGFYKSINSVNKQFIEINSQYYELGELEGYKLHEDDEVMILDVTELLPVLDFEVKLTIMDKQNKLDKLDYNYNWLKEVYKYLNTYEDIIFQSTV